MINRYILMTLWLLMPSVAWCHILPVTEAGWLTGFSHPFSGLDHLLPMLAIGIIANQNQRRWLALPLLFVCVMIIGAVMAHQGTPFSFAETGISLSLVVLGLRIAFPSLLPTIILLPFIGLFAFCHGHAHGAELAQHLSFVPYVIGFSLATVLLHISGIGIGRLVLSIHPWLPSISGIGMAAMPFCI